MRTSRFPSRSLTSPSTSCASSRAAGPRGEGQDSAHHDAADGGILRVDPAHAPRCAVVAVIESAVLADDTRDRPHAGDLIAPVSFKNNKIPVAKVWQADVNKKVFAPISDWIYLD